MDYLNTIFKATDFIHRNYDENILVSDIAEYVYLSPSYFSMVFRIITGYTVKEYVNQYRLYQAAKALKETDKGIISIAFQSGFSSQQSFVGVKKSLIKTLCEVLFFQQKTRAKF